MRTRRTKPSRGTTQPRRGLLALQASVLAVLLCGFGCEREDAALLRVLSVGQDEEALVLFVHGEGFFAGEKCTATVRGTLYGAFGQRSRIKRSWPCRARNEELAAVQLGAAQDQQGGVVEGTLELSFLSKTADRTFVATSAELVRIRLPTGSLSEVLAQDRASRALAKTLGVALEPHARGLLVTSTSAPGRAAAAGLAPRDVIIRFDGAPVQKPLDLAPAPDASAAVFDVLRSGHALSITIPLRGGGGGVVEGPLRGVVFAITFITTMLLPWSRPSARKRLAELRASMVGEGGPLALGSLLTLVSALGFAWGAGGPGLAFDPRWAFAAPWVAYATAALAPKAMSVRARARLVAELLSVAAGVACLALLSEAEDLFPRGASPERWLMACAPPAWFAWHAIQRGLPRLDRDQPLVMRTAAVWLVTSTAWLIAELALGGRGNHGENGAWSNGAFTLFEAGAVAVLLSFRSSATRFSAWLHPMLALLSAAAWLFIAPSTASTALIGYAAWGAASAWLVQRIVRPDATGAVLAPDPMLEPFR